MTYFHVDNFICECCLLETVAHLCIHTGAADSTTIQRSIPHVRLGTPWKAWDVLFIRTGLSDNLSQDHLMPDYSPF